MKRVVILGLNALEHDLVEKFDLRNLKQKEYGKIALRDFKLIITPTIWASFITGLPPERHKVYGILKWENTFLENLKRLSIKLGLDKIKNKCLELDLPRVCVWFSRHPNTFLRSLRPLFFRPLTLRRIPRLPHLSGSV